MRLKLPDNFSKDYISVSWFIPACCGDNYSSNFLILKKDWESMTEEERTNMIAIEIYETIGDSIDIRFSEED